MTHYKLLTTALLFGSLLLSACSLTLARSTNDPSTGPVPATLPQAGTTASAPSLGTTGATGQKESVHAVLTRSANAMLKVKSYDYSSTSLSRFGGSELTSTTKATVFPIQGDGRIETTQNEAVSLTYLKNNRMYMVDPRSGQWIYADMPKSSEAKEIVINPKVNDYMTVTPTQDGFLLKSVRALSALEFYMISGIEGKEMKNLADMVQQGIALDTVVEIELDREYRYRKVLYDQVTTTGGVATQTTLHYEYSNYDKAAPVVVPDEVVKTAQKLDTEAPADVSQP